MAQGWAQGAPHDELELMPLSDGGPGFLDVLARALGGLTVATTVSDALGREVPAAVLLVEGDGRRTAYVEAAQASGLHLLGADERDPGLTSTWGVGQLLEVAVEQGATKVVVGVGGSATNDAGAGMLAALGAGPASVLARGGLALAAAPDDALPGLGDLIGRLAGVELVLATDDDTPLLGLQSTSAVEAPRKGASPELAQALEGALGHFTDVVGRSLPSPPVELLSGMPRRLDREAGAGAAGGLGYGLLALGARRVGGVAEVLRDCGFGIAAARSDLVVTGAGRVDWSTLARVGRRRCGRRHARDRAPDRARRRRVPGRPARDDDPRPGRHLRRRGQPGRGRGDGGRPGHDPGRTHRAGGAHLVAAALTGIRTSLGLPPRRCLDRSTYQAVGEAASGCRHPVNAAAGSAMSGRRRILSVPREHRRPDTG